MCARHPGGHAEGMNATDKDQANQTEAAQDLTSEDREVDRPRELRRPVKGRMVAGVAAGLADYLNVDVTLVRIAMAVLVLVGGSGVALYLAGWLLIPEEGAEMSIAADFMGPRR